MGIPHWDAAAPASAELLRESGKPDEAAAELREFVRFWGEVKATWYLGELRKWADARGLPFLDEA